MAGSKTYVGDDIATELHDDAAERRAVSGDVEEDLGLGHCDVWWCWCWSVGLVRDSWGKESSMRGTQGFYTLAFADARNSGKSSHPCGVHMHHWSRFFSKLCWNKLGW